MLYHHGNKKYRFKVKGSWFNARQLFSFILINFLWEIQMLIFCYSWMITPQSSRSSQIFWDLDGATSTRIKFEIYNFSLTIEFIRNKFSSKWKSLSYGHHMHYTKYCSRHCILKIQFCKGTATTFHTRLKMIVTAKKSHKAHSLHQNLCL